MSAALGASQHSGDPLQPFCLVLVVLGACALLNLVANALLIPRFGPLGAAWATALTTALWNLTMYFAARARLGIRPSFF